MENELRDIKPLLEIPDNSYIVFLIVASFMSIIVLTLLYLLVKKLLSKRKESMKQVYFKRLKNIEWHNSKKAAYEVTFFARVLSDNDPRVKEVYTQLLALLENYKYRENVPSVDEETLKKYDLLVHLIDESL